MIIFPFSKKLDKGTHDILAIGNIMAEESPLLVKKIEFSSSAPVLVKIIALKESSILNGEDVTAIAVNSRIGKPIPPMSLKVIADPEINTEIQEGENTSLIKQMYVNYPYQCIDVEDGISLDNTIFIVLRIITQEKTIIAGNVILQKQMSFF